MSQHPPPGTHGSALVRQTREQAQLAAIAAVSEEGVAVLHFSVEEVGKTFGSSKKKYMWKVRLDGKEHLIEMSNTRVRGDTFVSWIPWRLKR